MLYLVDIDGTLADCTHRLHYIQQKPKDWRSFFKACVDDKPILQVIQTVQALAAGGANIVCMSGRSDEVQQETLTWLRDHHVPFDDLYMRQEGDFREDSITKAELLDKFLQEWNLDTTEITAIFDDRKRVVDMWRSRGLKVFQVAEGEF